MIKRLLLVILVLILGIVGYYWYMFSRHRGGDSGPKQPPIVLKKHSEKFNRSVDTAMTAYFEMKAAFVEGDTLGVVSSSKKFIQKLDSIPLDELKKDTAGIYETAVANMTDIKLNTESILKQPNITEMRHDFSTVSEILYPFFKVINYEGKPMYWQNCPMAFGEDKGANWISNTTEVVNPYLGKNHPEFRGTMLHCGSLMDTIKAQ